MRIITLLLAISFFNFKTDLSAMFLCTESVCWFIEQSTASLSDAVPAITVPLAVGGLVFGCIYYKRHILLQRAVVKLDKELIPMFLFFGADPSKINPETGASALHGAVQHGDPALLRLLLTKATKLNVQSTWGMHPLHASVFFAANECTQLLIDYGADPSALDKWGQTALHYAAYKGNSFATQLLLTLKADVNARSLTGQTPLYQAAEEGKKEAIRLLLWYGADATTPDFFGITPGQIASNNGHGEVARMLAPQSVSQVVMNPENPNLQKHLLDRRSTSVHRALQMREMGL